MLHWLQAGLSITKTRHDNDMKIISVGAEKYVTLKEFVRVRSRYHNQVHEAMKLLRAHGVHLRSYKQGRKHIAVADRVHSQVHGALVKESEARVRIEDLKKRASYLRSCVEKMQNAKTVPAVTITKREPSRVVSFLFECAIPAFFTGLAYALGVAVVLATIAWLG